MKRTLLLIQKILHDEEGVTAIEYALIASLIAMVLIVAARLLGTTLGNSYHNTANALD